MFNYTVLAALVAATVIAPASAALTIFAISSAPRASSTPFTAVAPPSTKPKSEAPAFSTPIKPLTSPYKQVRLSFFLRLTYQNRFYIVRTSITFCFLLCDNLCYSRTYKSGTTTRRG